MPVSDKVQTAQEILEALGLPAHQQNEMSAFVLLALADLKPDSDWADAKHASKTVTKGIMDFIKSEYGHKYAPNTRETVRRQVLHQFVQAGIVEYNPDNPSLPVNSPKAHYALTKEVVVVLRAFGTSDYSQIVQQFVKAQPGLGEIYSKKRNLKRVPVTLPNGDTVELSPGSHSLLQAAVIKEMASRFLPKAKLLYLGDTAQKSLYIAEVDLKSLAISVDEHEKLADVMLLSSDNATLFIVEVVTSHGPVSPKRFEELEQILAACSLRRVYITAFPDVSAFKKHVSDIAWETEVWIASEPDHMIHFNGPKFLK